MEFEQEKEEEVPVDPVAEVDESESESAGGSSKSAGTNQNSEWIERKDWISFVRSQKQAVYAPLQLSYLNRKTETVRLSA